MRYQVKAYIKGEWKTLNCGKSALLVWVEKNLNTLTLKKVKGWLKTSKRGSTFEFENVFIVCTE